MISKKEQKLQSIRIRTFFIEFLGYEIKVVGGKNPNKSYALIKDGKEIYRYSFTTSFGNHISLVKQAKGLENLASYIISISNEKV